MKAYGCLEVGKEDHAWWAAASSLKHHTTGTVAAAQELSLSFSISNHLGIYFMCTTWSMYVQKSFSFPSWTRHCPVPPPACLRSADLNLVLARTERRSTTAQSTNWWTSGWELRLLHLPLTLHPLHWTTALSPAVDPVPPNSPPSGKQSSHF